MRKVHTLRELWGYIEPRSGSLAGIKSVPGFDPTEDFVFTKNKRVALKHKGGEEKLVRVTITYEV